LGDGEDFGLVLAVPADVAKQLVAEQPLDTPLSMIGRFVAEAGLFAASSEQELRLLVPRGFEHRLES
jgi:thiamine monophosphate kinase